MEILHIIPLNALQMLPLADFLHKYDKKNNHSFMVCVNFSGLLNNQPSLLAIPNLEYMPCFSGKSELSKKKRFIIERCMKADHVVWHSLSVFSGYIPWILYKNRKLLKKSTWIVRDGELNNYTSVPDKHKKRKTPKVFRYVQRHIAHVGVHLETEAEVVKKLKHVHILPYPVNIRLKGLFEQVAELSNNGNLKQALEQIKESAAQSESRLEQVFEQSSKVLESQNPFSVWIEQLYENDAPISEETDSLSDNRTDDIIRIQFGLGSQSCNNHKEIYKAMSSITNEYSSIKAIVPMDYAPRSATIHSGTKLYKQTLKGMIHNSSIPVSELDKTVSESDMISYLAELDAVFLTNTQVTRIDFLLLLLAARKKLFVSSDTPLYRYLKSKDVAVQPLEMLETVTDDVSLRLMINQASEAALPDELREYWSDDSMWNRWSSWLSAISHNN